MIEREPMYCECGEPLRFVYMEVFADNSEVNISCECNVCGRRYIKCLEGIGSGDIKN